VQADAIGRARRPKTQRGHGSRGNQEILG
jgi:hypothetical protein